MLKGKIPALNKASIRKRFRKRLDENRIAQNIRGWIEYAKYGNSYKLRKKVFREFWLVKNG